MRKACALVGGAFGYMSAWVGAGKHVWDPSVTPEDAEKYLQYLWFGQTFNLTSMAALKFSICAFMLQLDFSKTFRMMIWFTVVIHTAFNVIFPYIIVFGECKMIAKHWDETLPGYCWGAKPRVTSGKKTYTPPDLPANVGARILWCCFKHRIRSLLHLCTAGLHCESTAA